MEIIKEVKRLYKKSKASSQVEFAKMLGEIPNNINAVLNGKRGVSEKKLNEWRAKING